MCGWVVLCVGGWLCGWVVVWVGVFACGGFVSLIFRKLSKLNLHFCVASVCSQVHGDDCVCVCVCVCVCDAIPVKLFPEHYVVFPCMEL